MKLDIRRSRPRKIRSTPGDEPIKNPPMEVFTVHVDGEKVGELVVDQLTFNRIGGLFQALDSFVDSEGREINGALLNIAAGFEERNAERDVG